MDAERLGALEVPDGALDAPAGALEVPDGALDADSTRVLEAGRAFCERVLLAGGLPDRAFTPLEVDTPAGGIGTELRAPGTTDKLDC